VLYLEQLSSHEADALVRARKITRVMEMLLQFKEDFKVKEGGSIR